MAVPRLADPRPFYLLDPAALTVPPAEAASIKGTARIAPEVDVEWDERRRPDTGQRADACCGDQRRCGHRGSTS